MSHSENLHQISIRQKKPQKLKNNFKKDHTRVLTDQGDPIPQLTKQLKDSTFKSSIENVSMELQNKRINGSGKLVFDDEGNLLSVPKLYPANKRQDESFTTDSHSNGSDNNILGNKIPIQWRFVSESYCNSTTNNQFGIKMNSKLRTARSSISNSSNKVRTRNRSLDLTGATVTPDLIRLQKIKNACINLPNTIDMVDLVAGVTISDGEHLKVGQLTVSSFY
ncbi:unnamed protein product [Schistosoma margrebowiei]|uniref:Uncharacterized protein n=1 Tax=Schistosoma margrebowiei TaxID=48269 RepID=A0A183LQU9_9TREM|nr:unnamed protein product [Schistosoma margrebowiei]